MITRARYLGMRMNALLQLQAEHLRMWPGEIRCWNERRDRVYYLASVPTLERALTSLGVISGPLFRLANGEPVRRCPEQAWQKIRTKAEPAGAAGQGRAAARAGPRARGDSQPGTQARVAM